MAYGLGVERELGFRALGIGFRVSGSMVALGGSGILQGFDLNTAFCKSSIRFGA